MEIGVQYWGAAGEIGGRFPFFLHVEPGTTLRELRELLGQDNPELARILGLCAVMLAGEVTSERAVLYPDARVEYLPPFAGG